MMTTYGNGSETAKHFKRLFKLVRSSQYILWRENLLDIVQGKWVFKRNKTTRTGSPQKKDWVWHSVSLFFTKYSNLVKAPFRKFFPGKQTRWQNYDLMILMSGACKNDSFLNSLHICLSPLSQKFNNASPNLWTIYPGYKYRLCGGWKRQVLFNWSSLMTHSWTAAVLHCWSSRFSLRREVQLAKK